MVLDLTTKKARQYGRKKPGLVPGASSFVPADMHRARCHESTPIMKRALKPE